MEITDSYLPEVLLKIDKEADNIPDQSESYDWEQYDDYLKPPRDEDGGEPEA